MYICAETDSSLAFFTNSCCFLRPFVVSSTAVDSSCLFFFHRLSRFLRPSAVFVVNRFLSADIHADHESRSVAVDQLNVRGLEARSHQ